MIKICGRIDSFSFKRVKKQIEEMLKQGEQYLVLDLEQAQFLSLPSIRYLSEVASHLLKEGG